jgi:hypothetical protein
MSTYPVDIKATTASGVATHDAGGAAAPGRALGLFVSKEGGEAASTVKILDNATVLAEFVIPATNQTNAQGTTTYMQFPGTGLRASTALKFQIVTTATSVTLLHG